MVKVNPTDRLALYVNGDYRWAPGSNGSAWGIATGGRFAITDRTGVSLRGEYVADNDNFLGFCGFTNNGILSPSSPCAGGAPSNFVPSDVEIWGVTGTVDHLLTDQLMVRAEVRWDTVNKTAGNVNDGEFFHGSINNNGYGEGLDKDQITLGAEVIYNFNKFGGE